MDTLKGETKGTEAKRYNIAMFSDFFFPNTGGVESHIFQVAQCLMMRGHKVVVVTHSYRTRKGVRYMTNGLKVYYLPFTSFYYNQCTLPTIGFSFPLMRNIFIREQIDIVHAHTTFSTMAHEAMLHARTMGLAVCFTDHSLFGFADAGAILLNKVLKFSLSDVQHVICVSNTSKENTVLRAQLDPTRVSVIPNAVDASSFCPEPITSRPSDKIILVVVARLVYRKGIDLLVQVIPEICKRYPNTEWLIGGDGPKRLELEEMREQHQLHDRVTLLGEVPNAKVRDLLVQGHIFVNCSLTEAFCIAIVEAACAGLLVVSTRVGGVPEVLPDNLIRLCEPDPNDMIIQIEKALPHAHEANPHLIHNQVKDLYTWEEVTLRTEKVYEKMMCQPEKTLIDRLKSAYGLGLWAGKIFAVVVAVNWLLLVFYEWLFPREDIEICPDFPTAKFREALASSSEIKQDTIQDQHFEAIRTRLKQNK